MRTRFTLFILLALMVSVCVYAQPGGYENPDPNPGGSGGSGTCYTGCTLWDNAAHCHEGYDVFSIDPGWTGSVVQHNGYSTCTAISVPPGQQGPPFCSTSGSCTYYDVVSTGGNVPTEERQVRGIETFLRESGVISKAALEDFIATTEDSLRGDSFAVSLQRRLTAYRAEFGRLVSRGDPRRELKPGEIPLMPHRPTKAPPTVTASK